MKYEPHFSPCFQPMQIDKGMPLSGCNRDIFHTLNRYTAKSSKICVVINKSWGCSPILPSPPASVFIWNLCFSGCYCLEYSFPLKKRQFCTFFYTNIEAAKMKIAVMSPCKCSLRKKCFWTNSNSSKVRTPIFTYWWLNFKAYFWTI